MTSLGRNIPNTYLVIHLTMFQKFALDRYLLNALKGLREELRWLNSVYMNK